MSVHGHIFRMEYGLLIQLEQAQRDLRDLKTGIDELGESLDTDRLAEEIAGLEEISGGPEFWSNPEKSQSVLKELSIKKKSFEDYKRLLASYEDTSLMIDIAAEDDDETAVDEIFAEIKNIQREYDRQRTDILLSGEYDHSNAILSIHPGAGGTEAQDWAQMLYRMYCRYAERSGFKTKVLDYLDGDVAGIKSVSVLVEGPNAYGYLKGENGVHRLVRVSPFDSSGRRHTSFASVEVLPEFDDDMGVEISESDLRIDTHRASGAGGQHVNKTDSAVRITHLPTGIVVGCQTERSQVQNRDTAMKMLKSKLLEIKEREHLDKIDDIKGVKLNIEWGSQIRSYVFMPYTLVKDNRTSHETGNITAVMDGEIDGFITSYLRYGAGKSRITE